MIHDAEATQQCRARSATADQALAAFLDGFF